MFAIATALGILAVFSDTVYCSAPSVKPSIFGAVTFFVVVAGTVSYLEVQIFGHPNLRTDLDSPICLTVTFILKAILVFAHNARFLL